MNVFKWKLCGVSDKLIELKVCFIILAELGPINKHSLILKRLTYSYTY